MSNDDFFSLRDRAYELAGTGRFKRWDQIARALKGEGFRYVLIARLHYDKLAIMMIDRCCNQARSGPH